MLNGGQTFNPNNPFDPNRPPATYVNYYQPTDGNGEAIEICPVDPPYSPPQPPQQLADIANTYGQSAIAFTLSYFEKFMSSIVEAMDRVSSAMDVYDATNGEGWTRPPLSETQLREAIESLKKDIQKAMNRQAKHEADVKKFRASGNIEKAIELENRARYERYRVIHLTSDLNRLESTLREGRSVPGAMMDIQANGREVYFIGDLHQNIDNLEAALNKPDEKGVTLRQKLAENKAIVVIMGDAEHPKAAPYDNVAPSVEITAKIHEYVNEFPGRFIYEPGNHSDIFGADEDGILAREKLPSGESIKVLQGRPLRDFIIDTMRFAFAQSQQAFIDGCPLVIRIMNGDEVVAVAAHSSIIKGGITPEEAVGALYTKNHHRFTWNMPRDYSPEDVVRMRQTLGSEYTVFVNGHVENPASVFQVEGMPGNVYLQSQHDQLSIIRMTTDFRFEVIDIIGTCELSGTDIRAQLAPTPPVQSPPPAVEFETADTADSTLRSHLEAHLTETDLGSYLELGEGTVFRDASEAIRFAESLFLKAYKGEIPPGTQMTISFEGANGPQQATVRFMNTGDMINGVDVGKSSPGGRVVIEVTFNAPVGREGVGTISSGNEHIFVQRTTGGRTETVALMDGAKPPTRAMYIVGGPYGPTGKFGLYTIFAGQYAPPMSDTSFWSQHAFLTGDKSGSYKLGVQGEVQVRQGSRLAEMVREGKLAITRGSIPAEAAIHAVFAGLPPFSVLENVARELVDLIRTRTAGTSQGAAAVAETMPSDEGRPVERSVTRAQTVEDVEARVNEANAPAPTFKDATNFGLLFGGVLTAFRDLYKTLILGGRREPNEVENTMLMVTTGFALEQTVGQSVTLSSLARLAQGFIEFLPAFFMTGLSNARIAQTAGTTEGQGAVEVANITSGAVVAGAGVEAASQISATAARQALVAEAAGAEAGTCAVNPALTSTPSLSLIYALFYDRGAALGTAGDTYWGQRLGLCTSDGTDCTISGWGAEKLHSVVDPVVSAIDEHVVTPVSNAAETARTAIGSTFYDWYVTDTETLGIREYTDAIGRQIEEWYDYDVELVRSAVSAVGDGISRTLNKANEGYQWAGQKVGEGLQAVADGTGVAAAAVSDGATNLVDSAIQAVSDYELAYEVDTEAIEDWFSNPFSYEFDLF